MLTDFDPIDQVLPGLPAGLRHLLCSTEQRHEARIREWMASVGHPLRDTAPALLRLELRFKRRVLARLAGGAIPRTCRGGDRNRRWQAEVLCALGWRRRRQGGEWENREAGPVARSLVVEGRRVYDDPPYPIRSKLYSYPGPKLADELEVVCG